MIRVAITEITKESKGEGFEVTTFERTLLLQEFEELDLLAVIAGLNGLQARPDCACGHPYHEGRCDVLGEPVQYPSYSASAGCDCTTYRTPEEAEVALLRGRLEDGREREAGWLARAEMAEKEATDLALLLALGEDTT